MFGYIRPFKPHFRMCEYDIYKAVYCGLCKKLGEDFGFPARFTVSYDFAFLGLLSAAINDENISIEPQRCMAHPLKKTPCAYCKSKEALHYPAAVTIMSTYHKLHDDANDKGLSGKLACFGLKPLIKKSYEKAAADYPKLALVMENNMKQQLIIERAKTISVDYAAEPTANIMSEIACGLSTSPDKQRVLARFGYLLGRYVYITDAYDDVRDDYNHKAYNPFLLQTGTDTLNLPSITDMARDSIYFTLSDLANSYNMLKIHKFKPILDNIVYIGLKNTFNSIKHDI